MKRIDARQVNHLESQLNSLKKDLLLALEDTNNKLKLIEDYNEIIRELDSKNSKSFMLKHNK